MNSHDPKPLGEPGAPQAGNRDATGLRVPGSAFRYHVAVHRDSVGISAACSAGLLIDRKDLIWASSVRPVQRCQRLACRRLWPKLHS